MPVSGEVQLPDGLDMRDDASFARVWRAQLTQIAIPFMGLPALTVSTGFVGRVPVGVQVVSTRYREDLCLLAGEAIESPRTASLPRVAHSLMASPTQPGKKPLGSLCCVYFY